MTLRDEIQRLGRQFEEEDNAAADLWSWLPSHKEAERHHGDYKFEFRPSNSDVMKEAAVYFADLKHRGGEPAPEHVEWYRCPCEEHRYGD